MRIYSEHGEDKWIAENLMGDGKVESHFGFYVDVGAMRPDQNSNTAFLRERGWAGIAIDGHPDCARHWVDVPCTYIHAAVIGAPGSPSNRQKLINATFLCEGIGHEAESRLHPGPDYAIGDGQQAVQVPVRTLNCLLEEQHVGTIDFLSIDIEGAEFEVLAAFDFEKYQPRIIVAEYDTAGLGKDYRVLELLLRSGRYGAVYQTPANIIYLRR